MLGFFFLQWMVMDHDHFIVIRLRHGKSQAVLIDLMRLKLKKCPVLIDVRNCSKQGLLFGRIVKPDHEEFVMPMWVGKFYTAIHRELERLPVDLDSGVNFNPFVRLVRATLGELAET